MTLSGGNVGSSLLTLLAGLGGEGGPAVRVGFLEGSTAGKNNDAPAAQIAYIHEFGAPEANIPSRPFFRRAISKNKGTWGKLLAAALKNNDMKAESALDTVGLVIGEQVQESIETFTTPGLKEATIARKGFDDPLQDSKNMKRAVNHEVTL